MNAACLCKHVQGKMWRELCTFVFGTKWRMRLQSSGGLGLLYLGLQLCIIECGPLQGVQHTPSNTV